MDISLAQREISHTTFGMGGIRTSILSVLASVENNNSAVQCSIDNGTAEVIFSPTVVLKVQGMSTHAVQYTVLYNILVVYMCTCNFLLCFLFKLQDFIY